MAEEAAAPVRWFREFRIAWIRESLEIFGAVQRKHVMAKFGISTAQASEDLKSVKERWPDLMEYDASEKVFKHKEAA